MRALVLLLVACGSRADDKPVPVRTPDAAPIATFDVPPPADKIVGIGRGTLNCVVRASGGVDCLGRFGAGKPQPQPRRIPGVTDAIAISPNADVVLRKTGQVATFLGDRLELATDPKLANVAAIGDDTCFIHHDRKVTCTDQWLREPIVLPVDDAVAVTRGGVTCVTRANGQVVCGSEKQSYQPFDRFGPIEHISVAERAGCAILATGALQCFAIRDGAIGEAVPGFDAALFANATALVCDGDSYNELLACDAIVGGKVVRGDKHGTRVLANLTDAVAIANDCALRAQGSVACWGSNVGGALGQPTTIGRMRRKPAKVPGATDIAQLALSTKTTWAITRGGKVVAWGAATDGRATEITAPAATQIVATHGSNACVLAGDAVHCWTAETRAFVELHAAGIKSIASDYSAIHALRADGSIVTTEVDPSTYNSGGVKPLPPPPAGTIALVSGSNPCAVLANGDVHCGTGWQRVVVDKVTRVASHWETCGITSDRDVRCWEYDFDKREPTAAKSLNIADAVDVAIGNAICTVRTNGAVLCRARFGKPTDKLVIPTGALDVEVGSSNVDRTGHACAIMADRTVTCWGSNFEGELGDGSIRESADPIGVRL